MRTIRISNSLIKAIMPPSDARLAFRYYFDYSGIMEMNTAVNALSGIAQESRLQAFRLLVQAGPDGLPAGQIGDRLGLAPATLSFHLATLRQAGLIQVRRAGRSLIYSADFDAMGRLIEFLLQDCCGGQACLPTGTAACSSTPANETTQHSQETES